MIWPVLLEEEGFVLEWNGNESLFQMKIDIGGEVFRDKYSITGSEPEFTQLMPKDLYRV